MVSLGGLALGPTICLEDPNQSARPDGAGQSPAMRVLGLALTLGCILGAFGAEESCEGRCDKGFDAARKCQCDELCAYYQSCCDDYFTICRSKETRGDVFLQPEDDYLDYEDPPNVTASLTPTSPAAYSTSGDVFEYHWTETPELGTLGGTTKPPTETPTIAATEEEEEYLCSQKPFDAFTSLKNGSIFAFRGRYFYELDEKSAMPGYPKLIRDVWGIEGPLDTAFTRINCEGKTYLFKGNQYWRFADGILEPDFPRNISDGFKGIPDDLDAAFALPAQNYFSSERVYFFKGRHYWSYDFAHQPSRQECEETAPSVVFGHYAQMKDRDFEDIFQILFGGVRRSGASRPRSIFRDWRGIPGRLDAAMLGRLYVAPKVNPAPRRLHRKPPRRHRKKYRRRQGWGRWDPLWDWPQESSESVELDWFFGDASPCQPLQTVYFFVEDKYYRLNLRTRRVDLVYPKYPRLIAKYWLGCPSEEEDLA